MEERSASPGLLLCLGTANWFLITRRGHEADEDARTWVRDTYGVTYRPGGMWSALHRLRVRWKVPRPVAERADPAAWEAR